MLTTFQRSHSDIIAGMAAGLWGYPAYELQHIGDSGNTVYMLQAGEERLILRLTNPEYRSYEENDAETEYLRHLDSGGVAVARPIASMAGRDVEQIHHEGAGLIASVFTWAPGLAVERDSGHWDEPMFRAWGRALGAIHAASETYQPVRSSRRWQWRDEIFFTRAHELIPADEPDIHEQLDRLFEAVDALPKEPASYGMVHADFAPQNFRYDPDHGITAFDFGNCCYHWYASDLAVSLSILRRYPREVRNRYRAWLLEGYLSARPDAAPQFATIPLFMQLRILYVYLSRLMKFGPEPTGEERGTLDWMRAAVREEFDWESVP